MNSDIRCPEVLLVDENNVKHGVVAIQEALKMAEEAGFDLVEVAPLAKPPVCRIMNYGKYRFQQQKRDKDARKKQKNQVVKEIKMRPKIDQHDYDFKVKAVKTFLKAGHRVKISVFFRGREMAFLDRGREVLAKVVAEISEFGKVEMEPRMEGPYMRLMVAPFATEPKKAASQDATALKPKKQAPQDEAAPKPKAKAAKPAAAPAKPKAEAAEPETAAAEDK